MPYAVRVPHLSETRLYLNFGGTGINITRNEETARAFTVINVGRRHCHLLADHSDEERIWYHLLHLFYHRHRHALAWLVVGATDLSSYLKSGAAVLFWDHSNIFEAGNFLVYAGSLSSAVTRKNSLFWEFCPLSSTVWQPWVRISRYGMSVQRCTRIKNRAGFSRR